MRDIWSPHIIYRHRDAQKALPCRDRAFWAIKRRDQSSGLTVTAWQEYKKNKGRTGRSREKRGIGPAHALNPILTIFGTWGGPLDMFLNFEFRVGRSPNFGATGVKNRPFPIQHTSLIQQLVATAQAVMLFVYGHLTSLKLKILLRLNLYNDAFQSDFLACLMLATVTGWQYWALDVSRWGDSTKIYLRI